MIHTLHKSIATNEFIRSNKLEITCKLANKNTRLQVVLMFITNVLTPGKDSLGQYSYLLYDHLHNVLLSFASSLNTTVFRLLW